MSVSIPFPTPRLADIAKQALEPDGEVKPLEVQRALTVQDSTLHAVFSCVSARMARVSLQSFLDNVDMIVRTMEELESL